MTARRLLAFVEWSVGAESCAQVFEPLVADWAREWHDARDAGAIRRLIVVVRGGLALMMSLGLTALRQFLAPPPAIVVFRASAIFVGAAALGVVALVVPLGLLWLARIVPPPRFFTDMWVFMAGELAPLTMAAALVPVLILLPTQAAGRWQSTQITVAGALATFVACAWIIPLVNRPLTTAIAERQRAQVLADDRAGRYTYPGTALRQLQARRPPRTAAAQARTAEAAARFRASVPANMTLPQLLRATDGGLEPGSIDARLRRIVASPLATIAFGLLGAGLATLGASRLRASVWWAVLLATLVAAHAPYSRLPFWAVAVTAATAGAWLLVRHAAEGQTGASLPSRRSGVRR